MRSGLFVLAMLLAASAGSAAEYNGRYCSGKGNAGYLRLIDQSFEFFHPNPHRQNISMLYIGKEERLCENTSWYMWWVQNSYGPTLCSLPYLKEPWVTALQSAQDLWFQFQGDGKRVGMICPDPAPDGSLCDCAGPKGVIYKQGDMDWTKHDWFYEAAAAGVLMQAELLLISRDMNAIHGYLPKLERACDFIERRRDARTNLFLVGPASNLLAPSYGGVRQPDGTFGRGYLAGLSVTYIGALDRMIELYKMTGDTQKLAAYERRRRITSKSLPMFLTDEGYFVKSLENNGTKHGVYGQERYGYFEVAPNVDAVCLRTVDDAASRKIMSKVRSIPELRPNGMLITNYPSLDDTYAYWDDNKGIEKDALLRYGRWVNGGVWTTMEARAVMAYFRTGAHDLLLRSAEATMGFAKAFQMDAPLPEFGKSVWFSSNSTNLCYDTLGVPAAIGRGLFEYVYKADSLTLYPHIHPSITQYAQKEPVRFGPKRITISVENGGPKIASVKVNGKKIASASDHVVLPYADLPANARVEITTSGKWPSDMPAADTSFVTADPEPSAPGAELPQDLAVQLKAFTAMRDKLKPEPKAAYEMAFVNEAISAYNAYAARDAMQKAGLYPDLSPDKQTAVLNWYRQGAGEMYAGFETITARYAAGSDARQKKIAAMWAKAKAGA